MLILITGGSGSGKSEYAEKTALWLKENISAERVIYIATMMPYGKETMKKIERHRKMRAGKGFITEECYCIKDIEEKIGFDYYKKSVVIIECMSNLTANEIFSFKNKTAYNDIVKGIKNIALKCGGVIIVTNDVFSDGVKYSYETFQYMDCLGKINRDTARIADKVVEVVCGIPLIIAKQ